jgi:hypothetical protein
MAAQLRIHAAQLYTDLGRLADDGASDIGLLADVYNTLLGQASKGFPEDKMIGTLTPVGEGLHPRVLQALTGQLTLVLGGFGP